MSSQIFMKPRENEEFQSRFSSLVNQSPFESVEIVRTSGFLPSPNAGFYFRLCLVGNRLKTGIVFFVPAKDFSVEGLLILVRKQLTLWGSCESREKIYLKAV